MYQPPKAGAAARARSLPPACYAALAAALFMAGMMVGSVRPLVSQNHSQQQQQQQRNSAVQLDSRRMAMVAGSQQGAVAAPAASSARTIYASNLTSLERLNANILKREQLGLEGCDARKFGAGWGRHHLCTKQRPAQPCHFYSFGVQTDYSFDVDVADTWGCSGFAADPTIVHNSTLHKGAGGGTVTFHNIAANSPWAAANAARNRWLQTSVPGLRRWLQHERVAVLKMDCEGCEYSIAADVLAEDPGFFHRVDQFALEVHWSRMWMQGRDELYALASLLDLLEEAQLQLVHVDLTPCGAFAARTGLLPELAPHMGVLFADGPQQHCHNYCFARLGAAAGEAQT